MSNVVFSRRVAGKLRWFTIGPHGPLAPEEAQALKIRALAKKGIDPRDAKPVMADLRHSFLLTVLQRPWRRSRTRAGLVDIRIHDIRYCFA